MRRTIAAAVLSLMTMVSVLSLTSRAASADVLSDTQTFLAKINALRSTLGLGTLTLDSQLTQVAQGWSQQMANAGDISHNPDLKNQVTSNWSKLGENVGMGPVIDDLFTAFVNSPHHYANLVDPSFNYIGIGVVYSNGSIFTTHDFMSLRGGSPNVTAPPATTATTRRTVTTRPPVVTVPPPPKPTTTTTTTTVVVAPPPAPVLVATVPDRIRQSLQDLLPFDPR